MSLAQSQTYWDDMAAMDPYYAILSTPGTKHGGWELDEFLATGESEIADLMDGAHALGLPVRTGQALDFGCGVGRLSQALATRFDSVVGIDISPSMIQRAEQLSRRTNCEFLANTTETLPFASDRFDLIYTAIVLQHVTSRRAIASYIREFVRTLRPGGVLVMQLPSYIPWRRRLQARRRLYSALRRLGVPENTLYEKLGLHPIAMNFLPEGQVDAIIRRAGGRILRVIADHRAGPHIVSRTYYASK